MPKPIRLTEDLIQKMAQEFAETIRKTRLTDGKVSYHKAFTYPGRDDLRVRIWYTPMAYLKQTFLMNHFSTEVAWHGVVERLSDEEFLIKDILMYPQVVTGTTVNTDQEKYQQWLMELDDDSANGLHMHAHSHVYMSTSPSTTDLAHQEQIVAQLDGDMFYIFMIWNKRAEHTVKVYDYKTNTMYEDSDVDIGIYSEGVDLFDFMDDSKEMVQTKSYASGGNYGSSYGGGGGGTTKYPPTYGSSNVKGAAAKPAAASKAPAAKQTSAISKVHDYSDVEDLDDYIFNQKNRIGFHQERMDV